MPSCRGYVLALVLLACQRGQDTGPGSETGSHTGAETSPPVPFVPPAVSVAHGEAAFALGLDGCVAAGGTFAAGALEVTVPEGGLSPRPHELAPPDRAHHRDRRPRHVRHRAVSRPGRPVACGAA